MLHTQEGISTLQTTTKLGQSCDSIFKIQRESLQMSIRNIFLITITDILYKIQKKISESWYQQEYYIIKVPVRVFYLLENKLKGIITTSNVKMSECWNRRFRIILREIGPFRELCSIGPLLADFHFSIHFDQKIKF